MPSKYAPCPRNTEEVTATLSRLRDNLANAKSVQRAVDSTLPRDCSIEDEDDETLEYSKSGPGLEFERRACQTITSTFCPDDDNAFHKLIKIDKTKGQHCVGYIGHDTIKIATSHCAVEGCKMALCNVCWGSYKRAGIGYLAFREWETSEQWRRLKLHGDADDVTTGKRPIEEVVKELSEQGDRP